MEENEKEKMQNTENETKAQEINKEGEKAPTQEVAKEVKKDENLDVNMGVSAKSSRWNCKSCK